MRCKNNLKSKNNAVPIDLFLARQRIDTIILTEASATEIKSTNHLFNVPEKYKFLFFNYNAITGLRIGNVYGLQATTAYRLHSLALCQFRQPYLVTL